MADDVEIYVLEDEAGVEHEFRELFSFDSEDFGKSYIVLTPLNPEEEDEEEVGILGFTFDPESDDGELIPIETDAEFDMVEEVMNTIFDNPDL
jgi:uncharacterized protein YrzB (UPF0473 family)